MNVLDCQDNQLLLLHSNSVVGYQYLLCNVRVLNV